MILLACSALIVSYCRTHPYALYINTAYIVCQKGKWWTKQDSNLQPSRYERRALTIELLVRTYAANLPLNLIGTSKSNTLCDT